MRARSRSSPGSGCAEQARPGPLRLNLKLSYQACNDRLCLAPATLAVPLDLNVAR